MITVPEDSPYSIYYIQALLNSKYLDWFSSLYGEVFRGGYIARGTKVLKKLPVHRINFRDEEEKRLHNRIADTQKELIRIQGEMDAAFGNKRQEAVLNRRFQDLYEKQNKYLKGLFNLGERDNAIPLISELYGTD